MKLFLHVTADEQARRIARRLAHPWKRSKVTVDALRALGRRDSYMAAADDMLAKTDTRWAPWHVIAADRRKHARVAALTRIADMLERAAPAMPPTPDATVAEAARAIDSIHRRMRDDAPPP